MGYSIVVSLPDTKTRDRVLAFLEKNMTPIHELIGEGSQYVRGPTDDPSYGNDDLADRTIGFDFSTSMNWQSRVAYRLCYWIVRQVPGSLFWYDGYDQQEIPEECDEHGFVRMDDIEQLQLARTPAMLKFLDEEIAELQKLSPLVEQELTRLSTLWMDGANSA